MSNPDKDLEDYLNGDSEVSKTYRSTMDLQPPRALDQAILREAHNAVKKKGGWLNWLRMGESDSLVPALSFAAVAVLAFVIVFGYQSLREGGAEGGPVIAKDKIDKGDNLVNPNKQVPQPVNAVKKKGAPAVPQITTHRSTKAATAYRDSADAWLKHIEKLKQEGKAAEAEQSMKEFKEKYPSHPTSK